MIIAPTARGPSLLNAVWQIHKGHRACANERIDLCAEPGHPLVCQQWTAEEFGSSFRMAGAEGATAPETLRQMDRSLMTLWKVVIRLSVFTHRR